VRLKREREMGMVDRRQADVRRASCRIELTNIILFSFLLGTPVWHVTGRRLNASKILEASFLV
jgi:hypothetical protein